MKTPSDKDKETVTQSHRDTKTTKVLHTRRVHGGCTACARVHK